MDDCIAVLGCTYIGGGGGTPRGGAQEVPEPPPPPLQGAHRPQIQVDVQAQHGSCIQAAKYNSNRRS
jgi:hypothetical protein